MARVVVDVMLKPEILQIMDEVGISESRRVRGLGAEPGRRAHRPLRPGVTPAVPEALPSRLVVLAGPTAVGKGTVAAYVRAHFPRVWLSVSMTTRHPRPGEVDGVHYHFVDDAEFDRLVEAGEFLEYAVVHGAPSTAPRAARWSAPSAKGSTAMLEIDLQGARQVRESLPEALFVFLMPPQLGRAGPPAGRSGHRGARRNGSGGLQTARDELAAASEFDVVIVNDDVRRASEELVSWMRARQRAV